MSSLGGVAEAGRAALERHDTQAFALIGELMGKNFGLRRKTYGDAVVGAKNLRAIELANAHGMEAKFTGSGGAIVCMRNEANADGLWFDGARELLIVDAFKSIGFQFERISVSKHTPFAV
jgi:mevalonate kinase